MGKSAGELNGRVKRKGVYFNLDDEDELLLFKKANEIKNFSKWVKKCLINDGVGIKEVKVIKEGSLVNDKAKKRIEKDDIDDMMM